MNFVISKHVLTAFALTGILFAGTFVIFAGASVALAQEDDYCCEDYDASGNYFDDGGEYYDDYYNDPYGTDGEEYYYDGEYDSCWDCYGDANDNYFGDDSCWDCYDNDYDNGYDGCYDSYCGDGDYDSCYDSCGDDYDGCFDYCGGNDDGCDYECEDFYDFDEYEDFDDEFYEETEDFYRDSNGARYSNSSASTPRFSTPSFSSAPRVSNMPNYPVSYPTHSSPLFFPNQPIQGHPASNTITNVDNSINGSFNDYSINDSFNVSDNSINNSFNTAIAQGGNYGVTTSIAAVTPGYTVAYTLPNYSRPAYVPRAPIFPASSQYVALSQIPYTGFDLGPIGNTIYWMSLMSIAAAGAYFLLYFKGGASALVGGFAQSFRTSVARTHEVSKELPVLSEVSFEKKELVANTKDTMTVTEKGIVINRSY